MTRVKVVSDLHLEFHDCVIENDQNIDVLILSGDICIADDLDRNLPEELTDVDSLGPRQLNAIRYLNFFQRVSDAFPHVIYIAGNHEFYHGKWVKSLDILRNFASKFSNVYFLECDTVKLGDVTFIGGTLWTDLNRNDPITIHAVADMMNDFRVIRNEDQGYSKLRPVHTLPRHRKLIDYIRIIIEGKSDEKFVVTTHHLPTRRGIHNYYKNEYIMNGAYASDLSEFILDHPQIKLWTCGHVHHPHWYYIGSTLVACNPRGYPGEGHLTNFNKNFVIDINDMPDIQIVENNYNHSDLVDYFLKGGNL